MTGQEVADAVAAFSAYLEANGVRPDVVAVAWREGDDGHAAVRKRDQTAFSILLNAADGITQGVIQAVKRDRGMP